MMLLNVGFFFYSFIKKMFLEICWGKNFVWKIFVLLFNGNVKIRFCIIEFRFEWKKFKFKINGMCMRNFFRFLSEVEILFLRRRFREKKKKKIIWCYFGVENCDFFVNCKLWEEKKFLVNIFFLLCLIDRKNFNGEIFWRVFWYFYLNE